MASKEKKSAWGKLRSYFGGSAEAEKKVAVEEGVAEDAQETKHLVITGELRDRVAGAAKQYAKQLHEAGDIPTEEMRVVGYRDLLSEYVGQSITKLHDKLDSVKGGILFIEEPYRLTDFNDWGDEVVEELWRVMAKEDADPVIVLGGRADKIQEFLQTYPEDMKPLALNHISLKGAGVAADPRKKYKNGTTGSTGPK